MWNTVSGTPRRTFSEPFRRRMPFPAKNKSRFRPKTFTASENPKTRLLEQPRHHKTWTTLVARAVHLLLPWWISRQTFAHSRRRGRKNRKYYVPQPNHSARNRLSHLFRLGMPGLTSQARARHFADARVKLFELLCETTELTVYCADILKMTLSWHHSASEP